MSSNPFLQRLLILLCSCVFIHPLLSAQNVGIGIATPVYKLDVRNGSINTDSAYRIGGVTVLSVKGPSNVFAGKNAGGPNITGSSNTAIGEGSLASITGASGNTASGKSSLTSNTTGDDNTAAGYLALNTNSIGSSNTAMGSLALLINTSGSYNTATGSDALHYNNTGMYNTATGVNALRSNTDGLYNAATGVDALRSNTGGDYNTATGVEALKNNDLGNFNAAHGYLALFSNLGGVENAAVGNRALFSNIYGGGNTAVGSEALTSSLGSFNIGIGYGSDVNPGGIVNVIALGSNLTVFTSNTARFGNTATTSYGGWAGWTNVSDGRFKKDILENVPGLDFINKLRPVTYTLDASLLDKFYHRNDKNKSSLGKEMKAVFETALQEKSKIIYTGFIAQEVEAAAKQLGFDFSGVDAAKNENDTYGLRYAEFVVPLVKAVQEQQTMIEALQKQNELLLQRITELEKKK
jgi:trimeric autotransporter adhesin